MVVPTVTINELSAGTQDPTTNAPARKVLVGILNDWMDLQYAKETDYTTGKRVIPLGCTIEDVDSAIANDTTEKKFKELFVKISKTYKNGDLTPQSKNDGTWDSKFHPVLVLVRPNL